MLALTWPIGAHVALPFQHMHGHMAGFFLGAFYYRMWHSSLCIALRRPVGGRLEVFSSPAVLEL